jgi:hypothetical protein
VEPHAQLERAAGFRREDTVEHEPRWNPHGTIVCSPSRCGYGQVWREKANFRPTLTRRDPLLSANREGSGAIRQAPPWAAGL